MLKLYKIDRRYPMTKSEIRDVMDKENGAGFSNNFNLNGYVFQKQGSFIVFELKLIEDVKVCHVKYIHYENQKDLQTILAYSCNFWMGNNVQFMFYKEKHRKNGVVEKLKSLGFREEVVKGTNWKWKFACTECRNDPCTCVVHSMFK